MCVSCVVCGVMWYVHVVWCLWYLMYVWCEWYMFCMSCEGNVRYVCACVWYVVCMHVVCVSCDGYVMCMVFMYATICSM